MPKRRQSDAMHVATTRRHYKDKTYETHLLRRSFRDDHGRPRNETLANLSHLPADTIEVIRRTLKGETFVPAGDTFTIERSLPHGHVAAVAIAAPGRSWPPPGGGPTPPWLTISTLRARPPTTSTPRWTGWSTANTPSKLGSRTGISTTAGWCTTTCRRPTSKAATVSLARWATPATVNAASCSSPTG